MKLKIKNNDMDKIKIEFNGYTIFANSAQEAREIVNGSGNQLRRTKDAVIKNDDVVHLKYNKSSNTAETPKRHYHKKGARHLWTTDEAMLVAELLKTRSKGDISRSKTLRKRHTRGSIYNIALTVEQNPSYATIGKDVLPAVTYFQSWKRDFPDYSSK